MKSIFAQAGKKYMYKIHTPEINELFLLFYLQVRWKESQWTLLLQELHQEMK